MAFEDLVAKLTEGVENIGDVEAFVNDLKAEHAKELDVRQTKITRLEEDLTGVNNALTEVKLTNYDLIMKTAASGGSGDPDPSTEPPKTQGVKSLFKPKE